MKQKPYGLICPITRACELLEPRWTIAILVGLWSGASKFNELRREVGSISPTLLSRRLKELEELGLVERVKDPATGAVDYIRTETAIALEPALKALGEWAQCHVDAQTAMESASAASLMWDMRKYFVVDELPRRRVVLQFRFSDEPSEYDRYWVVIQPGAPVEICTSIPGYDVDLYVEANVISLLGIFMGRSTFEREEELGELYYSGDALLSRTISRWLRPHNYASFEGIRQLPEDRRREKRAAG
ncbi:winged helix-turn-helix transcriptional regulator [Lutimaribacter saemankumensis]|uniref:DNA-binding transcriptional regulator, HxlR family n=1 Tax=Lutimaribacter saemankumensis TaxID=490829 RepID=A0A1G8TTN3_9RHOB|nr:helix-turn-helix domain-containing protein [Lutimaribacter saemankumensis]SDJ44898.1 DNA-binding transcriptional regulator, HxlR family [Lutimaribacter saemankumensis]